MKLKAIKLANSVKVGIAGGEELQFFQCKDYDLTLVNSIILRIQNKRSQAVVCSSLFNCVYFIPDEEEAMSAPDSSKGTPAATGRGVKAKAS
jgi:hypothetical protein